MYSFLRGRLEKEEAKRYLAFTPYQNIKKFLEEIAVGNIFRKKNVNYIILKSYPEMRCEIRNSSQTGPKCPHPCPHILPPTLQSMVSVGAQLVKSSHTHCGYLSWLVFFFRSHQLFRRKTAQRKVLGYMR